MLGRYAMHRGRPAEELPSGERQDTRKHTRHPLRPTPDLVERYLARDIGWGTFAAEYGAIVAARFAEDPAPFDAIAEAARAGDVWLGCSCPTKRQPRVDRCHTWLALEFMSRRYPDLDVSLPGE